MCFTKIVVKMLIFLNTIRIYKYIGHNLWICQQDTDALAGFQDPFSCNEISVKSSLLERHTNEGNSSKCDTELSWFSCSLNSGSGEL